MDKNTLHPLMIAWDNMDSAAQRVLVAMPSQMTAAAEGLDIARRAMRDALNRALIQSASAANK
jgi:hypothetical protein